MGVEADTRMIVCPCKAISRCMLELTPTVPFIVSELSSLIPSRGLFFFLLGVDVFFPPSWSHLPILPFDLLAKSGVVPSLDIC